MNAMPASDILARIVRQKRMRLQQAVPVMTAGMRPAAKPLDFAAAIRQDCRLSVIAEIKKSSPSRGLIQPNFHPIRQALAYEKAGVSAISVLTEEDHFGGSMEHLRSVAAAVSLPVLCKDFILEESQIDQAYESGASAILLITAILDDDALSRFIKRCHERSLSALVEVHDLDELMRALQAGARIIGINNRDLKTFSINLGITERLAGLIPQDRIVVSESGIVHAGDMARVYRAGAHAVLIGETLMRAADSVDDCLRDLQKRMPSWTK